MSTSEALRNFRSKRPSGWTPVTATETTSNAGPRTTTAAKQPQLDPIVIDLVSDEEGEGPTTSQPTPHAFKSLASGNVKPHLYRRSANPSPEEDRIIYLNPRTKKPALAVPHNPSRVLPTAASNNSTTNSSRNQGFKHLLSENTQTEHASAVPSQSEVLSQNSSERKTGTNYHSAKITSAPANKPSAAQQSTLKPIQERSKSFFLKYKDRFSPLLSLDNTFFEDLEAEHPPDAFVKYSSLQNQPAGIEARLKPYQLQGLSFLVWLYLNGVSGILGDQMGLGKTLQILSLFQYLRETESNSARTSLVVCPLTVLNTWVSEAKKFTPNLSVHVIQGSQAARENQKTIFKRLIKKETPPDLVITTYPTIQRETIFFSRARWCYLVLDEGHTIKNPKSDLARSIGLVKAQLKLAVTGTPLQNNLSELWSILNILFPQVLTRKSHAIFSEAFDLSHGAADPKLIDATRRLLDLIMLRRTEQTPGIDLKLPLKKIVHLRVPLTPLQRDCYMSVLAGIAALDPSQDPSVGPRRIQPQNGKALRNTLLELRQVCSHPFLFQGDDSSEELVQASSKFVVLEKLVHEIIFQRGEKMILFSEWLDCLSLVGSLLSIQGINGQTLKYLRLDGDTPVARRNLIIDLFQNKSSGYDIILVSIGTGGQGITLTAATAVVILEDNWNPQNTLQAEARAHRIGQTRPVTVYKIFTSGTVEEQMLGRIQKKLYLAQKVTESTTNINSLATQDADGPRIASPGMGDIRAPLTMSELHKIIKRGTESMRPNHIDTAEMTGWSFNEMIDKCEQHQVHKAEDDADRDLTQEEEQQWLNVMERVKTTSFEGQVIKRKTNFMIDETQQWLDPRERRIGKNRTVKIDGIDVLKESLWCRHGESVPTLTTPQPKPKEKVLEWTHEKYCHKCSGGGNVFKCGHCPRVYHEPCTIGRLDKSRFTCGQHHCYDCGNSTAEAGGMLFKCQGCERALCTACLKEDEGYELLEDTIPEFVKCDFFDRKGAFWFIQCSSCKNREPLELQDFDDTSSELSSAPSDLSSMSPRPRESSKDGPTTPKRATVSLPTSLRPKVSPITPDDRDKYRLLSNGVNFSPTAPHFTENGSAASTTREGAASSCSSPDPPNTQETDATNSANSLKRMFYEIEESEDSGEESGSCYEEH